MSINKFNAEGYHDPTVYEALTNIEKKRSKERKKKIVFICSPFAGDIDRTPDEQDGLEDLLLLRKQYRSFRI